MGYLKRLRKLSNRNHRRKLKKEKEKNKNYLSKLNDLLKKHERNI